MEEIKKEEEIVIEETTPAPEPEEKEVEKPEVPEETDTNYKKELEALEQKPKNEEEKARKALFFNAQRARELGIDLAEVLGIKPKGEAEPTVPEVVQREFDVRELRSLSEGNEDMYKLMLWYVDNRKLNPEEAYILANKGKLQRSIIEAKRGKAEIAKPSFGGKKAEVVNAPEHPGKDVLLRRGYIFNSKTKTYQGKFYEEFWNGTEWTSRKIPK